MFSKELQEYILHGKEERNLEYKYSMSWLSEDTKLKIIRSMLAMANYTRGGVIVIGVKQVGSYFKPVGMKKSDYDSYDPDIIGQYVRNHSDPLIRFTIVRDEMDILNKKGKKERKKFCIIQIRESLELPVISTQQELYDKNQPAFSKNICVRRYGVYIRSESPIGSREIQNSEEWRELLYRCIEKINIQARKITGQEIVPEEKFKRKPTKEIDEKKFKNILKRDKLE